MNVFKWLNSEAFSSQGLAIDNGEIIVN